MVLGLAAIITYYKGGKRGEDTIVPNDDQSIIDLLQNLWASNDLKEVAKGVLGAKFIWGENLNKIPGLTLKVTGYLISIQENGMLKTVKSVLHEGQKPKLLTPFDVKKRNEDLAS